MSKPLLLALSVPAALAAASVAGADDGDATRLKQFAAQARGTGSLIITAKYTGDEETCAEHDTCGVRGSARARLRFDRTRPIRVAEGVLVIPVTGSVRATVRDTVAGHVCRGAARIRTAGLAFRGDKGGLLLRVGVAPKGSGVADPFDTQCRAPKGSGLGRDAFPSVRVKVITVGIASLGARFSTRRSFDGQGYRGTVDTTARLRLTRG